MTDSRTLEIALRFKDQLTGGTRKALTGIRGFGKGAVTVFSGVKRAIMAVKDAIFALPTALAVLSGAGLFLISKQLVEAASDATETQSKFDELFRGIPEAANDAATGLASALGRSQRDIQDGISGFQGLLTPMGLVNEQGLAISATLTRLGVDLASFFNTADDDALLALRSGLLGQTEPLQRYGIDVRAARVQNEAFRIGLAETKDDLDAKTLALARLSVILKDSRAAQTDAIRTADNFANRIRAIRSQLGGLQVEAGRKIIQAIVQGIDDAGGVDRILEIARGGLLSIAEISRVAVVAIVQFADTAFTLIEKAGGPEGLAKVVQSAADVAIANIELFGAKVRANLDGLISAARTVATALNFAFGTVDVGPTLGEMEKQGRRAQEALKTVPESIRQINQELIAARQLDPGPVRDETIESIRVRLNGLRAASDNAKALIEGLPDSVKAVLKAEQELGAFFEMPDVGEESGKQFKEGFALGVADFERSVTDILALTINSFDQAGGETGNSLFKGVGEKIMGAQKAVGTFAATFINKMAEAGEAETTLREQLEDLQAQAKNSFSSGLGNAFAQFATGAKSAKEAFKDFGRSFITQIISMTARLLVFNSLGFLGLANGGVVGGGMGTLTPLANGGIVPGGMGTQLPLKGYANGGPIVNKPHVALIGEGKHNEAVVPLPDGRSIPVEMKGGGSQIVNNYYIEAMDAASVQQVFAREAETLNGITQTGMATNRGFRKTMMGKAT